MGNISILCKISLTVWGDGGGGASLYITFRYFRIKVIFTFTYVFDTNETFMWLYLPETTWGLTQQSERSLVCYVLVHPWASHHVSVHFTTLRHLSKKAVSRHFVRFHSCWSFSLTLNYCIFNDLFIYAINLHAEWGPCAPCKHSSLHPSPSGCKVCTILVGGFIQNELWESIWGRIKANFSSALVTQGNVISEIAH